MANSENNEILNPRENNKTNRERREKEAKQIKWLKLGGIAAAGVVVVLLIVGLISYLANQKSKVVATVGDEKITLDEFQQAVRLQRSNLIDQYDYYKQLYGMFGMPMDASTKAQYQLYLDESFKGLLGQEVLTSLIDKRILAMGAEKEGITVSDEEVENQYAAMFRYYPNGEPTPAPTDEPFAPTPTVSDEQLAILRYTATPEPTEVPAAEEETVEEAAEVAEVAEEAAEAAEEVVEEAAEVVEEAAEEVVEAAEEVVEEAAEAAEEVVESEPEPTVAPTEYTKEMFQSYQDTYFANKYYINRDFFKKQLYYDLLQDKVEAKLKESLPREADMVWARHILVATEEEAQAALKRIEDGEEWGDVCLEVSTDGTASKGGDLGWFAEGRMVKPFSDAAFAAEVGSIAGPVQSDYGWHLIQIIGHEVRPFTASDYDDALSLAYQNWLDSYSADLTITTDEKIADLTPTDPEFVE